MLDRYFLLTFPMIQTDQTSMARNRLPWISPKITVSFFSNAIYALKINFQAITKDKKLLTWIIMKYWGTKKTLLMKKHTTWDGMPLFMEKLLRHHNNFTKCSWFHKIVSVKSFHSCTLIWPLLKYRSRRFYNPVEHLRWSFFAKVITGF